MAIRFKSTTVTNVIGCDKLELVKGDGYWYFVYDDIKNNIYQTCSVMVHRLNHMPLYMWVQIGMTFVKTMKEKDE